MLAHDLADGTRERRLAGQHEIERRAQGIDIRADVHFAFFHLFRAGEVWRADKSAHRERAGVFTGILGDLGQSEVDDFDHQFSFLVDQHQVGRLQVAMNQLLFGGDRQCASHLERNIQRLGGFRGPLRFTRASTVSPSMNSMT